MKTLEEKAREWAKVRSDLKRVYGPMAEYTEEAFVEGATLPFVRAYYRREMLNEIFQRLDTEGSEMSKTIKRVFGIVFCADFTSEEGK